MTVLVADKFEKSGLDGLHLLEVDVLYEPELKDEVLGGVIKDQKPEVLIVRSTKVTRQMMEGTTLKLIIRAGAGYNTIDTKSATEFGVQVANCPGMNARAVAELAFGLMIALDRRIPENVSQLRAGKWNKKEFSKARGLADSTLGLLGVGNIGRDMIARARAFGMHVIGYSGHYLQQEEADILGIERARDLHDLAARSDVISVHLALTDETKGLCDAEFFAAMKPGAIFVNTSRAEVIDQAALLKAVSEKGIKAGLDVFEGEPTVAEGEYEGELCSSANVYCTHHIGASTDQAQEAVAAETVRIVKVFMETGCAPNVVN